MRILLTWPVLFNFFLDFDTYSFLRLAARDRVVVVSTPCVQHSVVPQVLGAGYSRLSPFTISLHLNDWVATSPLTKVSHAHGGPDAPDLPYCFFSLLSKSTRVYVLGDIQPSWAYFSP
jgi:hypothetical protein